MAKVNVLEAALLLQPAQRARLSIQGPGPTRQGTPADKEPSLHHRAIAEHFARLDPK